MSSQLIFQSHKLTEYLLRDRSFVGAEDIEWNKIERVPVVRVRRPLVNSTTKQANVIIMGITFRGSTECHRVVKKGDYQVWYQLNMRSLIMNRDIPGSGE